MWRRVQVGGGLTLILGCWLAFDVPVAYADNCGSLGDCFYTIAAALAVIAALALIIAGIIALPALLAALAGGGGAGLALAGGGTFGGAMAIPATAAVATNIAAAATAAAAAAAAAGSASDLIMQMSSEGTPGNNQAQNKQFRDAVRQAEKDLKRNLSKDEIRQIHDEITGQNMGFHEIIETIIGMFGK
jgi:hypothetical protein